ncbi:hypothetical protein [Coleofasciculus sp. G2-EDA-02]
MSMLLKVLMAKGLGVVQQALIHTTEPLICSARPPSTGYRE